MPFEDTQNKAAIRLHWDLPMLRHWREKQSRPSLTYFGLTGPSIHDLLDWRAVLDRRRTGIQELGHKLEDRERAQADMGQLLTNLFAARMSSGFQLLRGDVEDVLIDGVDHDNKRPQISDDQPAHVSRFRYDLVNLDFEGGIGHRNDQGYAKRIAAIKDLFRRQEGCSFLLFLTVNVRDTMGSEIEDCLLGLRSLSQSQEWRKKLDWYLGRGDGERAYKLKAAVPSFVRVVAESRVFRCLARPPVYYRGHNAYMIHFAFELDAVTSDNRAANLRGYSTQSEFDLIELPLLRCEEGRFRLDAIQHPGFDLMRNSQALDFLSAEQRAVFVATLQGVEVGHNHHE